MTRQEIRRARDTFPRKAAARTRLPQKICGAAFVPRLGPPAGQRLGARLQLCLEWPPGFGIAFTDGRDSAGGGTAVARQGQRRLFIVPAGKAKIAGAETETMLRQLQVGDHRLVERKEQAARLRRRQLLFHHQHPRATARQVTRRRQAADGRADHHKIEIAAH